MLLRRINTILLAAVASVFAGCNRSVIYSRYEAITDEVWLRDDSICLTVDQIRAESDYMGAFQFRTKNTYPYRNLTVTVRQQSLHGAVNRIDTLSLMMTDNDGVPQGNGLNHYQYEATLPAIHLAAHDTLKVIIRHQMTDDALTGICDIGFSLKKLSD